MAALKVHIHTSSPDAFFVNSFIVEGETSLVLVDTQFLLSEAATLVGKIAALNKPLGAIFISHPHPDHYNGLATVLASFPGTQVLATAATLAGIRATVEPKRAYWTPIVGADYPQTFRFPDVLVADGQRMNIDGIEFQIVDLGPAECSDNTMIALPQVDAVIVSDLVYNRVHPWVAEGRSVPWLRALVDVEAKFGGAATFYPGHGTAGSAVIFREQASYIATVRELVENMIKTEGHISDAGKSALVEKIDALHPGWPLNMIIGMNVDGVASELQA